MLRQLDEKEKERTLKGIDRLNKEIKDIEESLSMKELQANYLKVKREFEDRVRPFNRKIEDDELKITTENLQEQINQKEFAIKSMLKQINEGVEVKDNLLT